MGTSREVGIGAVESAAVVEAEGGVIREGVVVADGKLFTTGILAESTESTSVIGPTTPEKIGLNDAG